jgi:hypothetical protein
MSLILPRSILTVIVLSVCFFVLIFILDNLNTRTNDRDLSLVKCDCPTLPPPAPRIETSFVAKVEVPVAPKIDVVTSARTLPPLPPCQPVEKNSPVQRAIIIYYPHHQSEYFFPEIRWYI